MEAAKLHEEKKGDVFGCPIEGWRENQIKETYVEYKTLPSAYPQSILESTNYKRKRSIVKKLRPIGLHSDDTQQCLALLNILLHNNGKWDKSQWCSCLITALKTRAFRGYGRNFAQSVGNLSRGSKPEESGSASSELTVHIQQGMGGAMRIGPLGAFFRDAPEEEHAACVWEATLITHATLCAAALAYAVSAAVKLLVTGTAVEKVREVLPTVVSAQEKLWLLEKQDWQIGRENYHLVSSTLRTIFTECDLTDRTQLRHFISRTAKPFLAAGFSKAHVNQGFVGLGGTHGLVMALLPDIEPQSILNEIVALGYDTDTVAAICGTVLGARFGTSWIPLDRLLDVERLHTYAEALISRKHTHIESTQQFMTVEANWTATEKQFQRELLSNPSYFPTDSNNKLNNNKKLNKRQKQQKNKELKRHTSGDVTKEGKEQHEHNLKSSAKSEESDDEAISDNDNSCHVNISPSKFAALVLTDDDH